MTLRGVFGFCGSVMLGADIAGARVALGKTGKTYILVADRSQAIAACQRILDAHGSRLQWPAGVDEVAAWVEAVLRAAAKGTGLAATSYNLKCVTRKALLLLSPAVYQGFLDGVHSRTSSGTCLISASTSCKCTRRSQVSSSVMRSAWT